MNLLEHVQNGQHFCLKAQPQKIYKKIHNIVRLHRSHGRRKTVVKCRSLRTGTIIEVEDPDKVTVIPLGEPE